MTSAATNAKKSDQPKQLTVGAHVFHPAHGVAEVVGIETRTVGEEQMSFYVLELVVGGKILLPMDNVKQSALRPLISVAHARKLMKRVTTEPELNDKHWKERSELYAEALKDGDADGYADILRQLLFRSKNSKLNMTERRQLDMARSYFVHEIGLVLDQSAKQVDEQLRAAIEGSPPKK